MCVGSIFGLILMSVSEKCKKINSMFLILFSINMFYFMLCSILFYRNRDCWR